MGENTFMFLLSAAVIQPAAGCRQGAVLKKNVQWRLFPRYLDGRVDGRCGCRSAGPSVWGRCRELGVGGRVGGLLRGSDEIVRGAIKQLARPRSFAQHCGGWQTPPPSSAAAKVFLIAGRLLR